MFDLLFEMIYPLYIERCKEIYKKVLQDQLVKVNSF